MILKMSFIKLHLIKVTPMIFLPKQVLSYLMMIKKLTGLEEG